MTRRKFKAIPAVFELREISGLVSAFFVFVFVCVAQFNFFSDLRAGGTKRAGNVTVEVFPKHFDGYITGSLGPAGSQIRKMKILNNFFSFAFRAASKNSAPRQKNTEPIALIKKFVR